MSLILVIEQDGSYTERIKGALAAEGWTVRVVGDRDAAMLIAAKDTPDLVLVSTAVRGAPELLRSFGRVQGGPGALALGAAGQTAVDGADGTIAKPFTDEQLRASVRRCLSRGQKAAAEAAAEKAASAGAQLTSHDLFGDLLAEVEEEAARPVRPAPARAASDFDKQLQQTLSGMLEGTRTKPAPKPSSAVVPPPPAAVTPAPAAAAPAPAPPAAVAPSTAPAAAAGAATVAPPPAAAPAVAASTAPAPAPPAVPPLPTPPVAAAPPVASAPPPAAAPPAAAPPATGSVSVVPRAMRAAATAKARAAEQAASDDVEDLLSQTLSGLGVGPRTRRATPSGPVPAAAAAVPVAAAAAAPAAPPRQEPPAPTPVPAREEPPAPARPPVAPPPPEPARRDPPAREGRERGRDKRAERAAERAAPPPPAAFATVRVETARPATLDQFGAYTLLDRVALGGMAEVWKARMKGVEGFQKTVAIKKILPHLTDSVDFVTMFIDEAKLAAQLNHPNIIHIYDLGKLDEDYYIAMEYVEGKDLRSILNTARKREQALPVGLALLIAARLASALDYAHRKRDFDNRELGLVHRDVSPQNVLISYEGDIKLCDFGIVKAVAKASKTQMGALKGKLQYMSPEQAWGRVVDARSDIFSLGSVLFEMLTGRRLFAGESEISVLEAVREARIQSVRELDPGISETVDAIVRRALAKDPDDRYQTAGEMQKELEAVLYGFKPTPSQGEVAAFMHRLYSDEAGHGAPAAALAAPAAAAGVPSAGAEVPAVAPMGGLDEGDEGARRRPWLLPAAAAFVLVVGALVFFLTRGGSPPASPAAAAAPAAVPAAVVADPAVVPAALPAAVPGGTAAMERMVQQQLQAKEAELKAQLEVQRRQMQAEIKNQPAASAAPSAKPSPAQVAAAAAPSVAPAPTRAAEEAPPAPPVAPPVREPEPEPAAVAPDPEPAPASVREGDFVAPGTPGLASPAFVSVTKPEYPALAKRLAVQGVVVVSVLVNEQGVVEQARIVRGIPQKVGINEAALAAAKTARYRPATLGGVRVKTWANLSLPFKL